MPKSPEMREAETRLRDAVQHALNVREAERGEEEPGVITDFCVLFATTSFDEDGDRVTGLGTLIEQGAVGLHSVLGLVQYGVSYWSSAIANPAPYVFVMDDDDSDDES